MSDHDLRALERDAAHSIPALVRLAEALDRAGRLRRPKPMRGYWISVETIGPAVILTEDGELRRERIYSIRPVAGDMLDRRDRVMFATFPAGWTCWWTVYAIEGLLNLVAHEPWVRVRDLARAILFDGPHSNVKRLDALAGIK